MHWKMKCYHSNKMRRIEQEYKIIAEKHGGTYYFFIVSSTPSGMKYVTGALRSLAEAQLRLEGIRRKQ